MDTVVDVFFICDEKLQNNFYFCSGTGKLYISLAKTPATFATLPRSYVQRPVVNCVVATGHLIHAFRTNGPSGHCVFGTTRHWTTDTSLREIDVDDVR